MTLPNFIIIGVAKAGTTSLNHYLDQHSQIFMCPVKETNFFGYEDARAWAWTDEGSPPMLQRFRIKTLEAYEALFDAATDEIAIGEASPQYFRSPTAAQRIHELIPDVKLVVSLRNPADRAFSGFLMRTRRGEAVKSIYEELTPESSHHVREGFYYRRLKRYFDIFDRDHIKVLIFEEFKEYPAKIITDLFEFLGVNTNFVPDTSIRYNPAAIPKIRLLNRLFFNPTLIRTTKSVFPESVHGMVKRLRQVNLRTPPMFPADLRTELIKLYRDDILQLEFLLERDLSIWFESR